MIFVWYLARNICQIEAEGSFAIMHKVVARLRGGLVVRYNVKNSKRVLQLITGGSIPTTNKCGDVHTVHNNVQWHSYCR